MLEMLICICLLSIFVLLSSNNTDNLNLDHYQYLNKYLNMQSLAMQEKDNVDVDNGLYFNSMGHVNQAKTISFGKHSVIVHLGNGYATAE